VDNNGLSTCPIYVPSSLIVQQCVEWLSANLFPLAACISLSIHCDLSFVYVVNLLLPLVSCHLCWCLQGIVINGCIRDSDDISRMPLGVKALNTYPLKSSKRDLGLRDIPVTFAGTTFVPGNWLYADKDGILVSPDELTVK
jgi:hypothetical protein